MPVSASTTRISAGQRRSAGRWLLVLMLGVLLTGSGLGGAVANAQTADTPLEQYFAALRQRRLFNLAESYCMEQLARERLDSGRRLKLTLELSRTFAEHARYTTGQEQEDLWQNATRVLDEFLTAEPEHAQRDWLIVQRAMIPAARGEFLQAQSELAPHDDDLRNSALAATDTALESLFALEEPLDERLSEATRLNGRGSDPLDPRELRTLLYQVRFQLAAGLLNRARLLPPKSANRTSALLKAEGYLERLAGGAPDELLTWNSLVALAETARLQNDWKKASARLLAIQEKLPPREIEDQVVAEQVRLYLDQNQPDDAGEVLVRYRQLRTFLPGELRFLKARVFLALWEIAEKQKQKQQAEKLLELLQSHVDRAEREIGGYWGYRCRRVLDFARRSQEFGGALAGMVEKARSLYASGRIGEAAAAYETAVAEAIRSGQNAAAMELGYTRGSILLHAGKFDQSAQIFGELAERYPEHEKAAPAHLLHAYALGRIYGTQRSRESREAYSSALTEHREKFSDDPTAGEATFMLAQLEESRRQVSQALRYYAGIPADHARGPDAQVAVARCFELLSERLADQPAEQARFDRDAARHLEGYLVHYPQAPLTLNLDQARVAIRTARLYLGIQPPNYQRADELLAQVFASREHVQNQSNSDGADGSEASSPELVTAWNAMMPVATQLRIVSLAGQREFAVAQKLVREMTSEDPEEVLAVLDGLTQLARHSSASAQRGLGEVQLQAALDLDARRTTLDATARQRLDRCLAEAYLATDQASKAMGVYERLLEAAPRDKTLQKTYGELLLNCGTRPCLLKAKDTWRTIESLETAGSEAFLQARYNVALCCYRLQQFAECRKLLGVTKLLYPPDNTTELGRKYTALEQAVSRGK